jgi:hypothetical protein
MVLILLFIFVTPSLNRTKPTKKILSRLKNRYYSPNISVSIRILVRKCRINRHFRGSASDLSANRFGVSLEDLRSGERQDQNFLFKNVIKYSLDKSVLDLSAKRKDILRIKSLVNFE